MAADPPPPDEPAGELQPTPVAPSKRRPFTRFALLAFGILVALYFGQKAPREQHVRVVLGAAAPDVTAVELQYVNRDGDLARETRLIYPPGGAPRVVAHEPRLPDGEYRLQIDVDAHGGRRTVQRQVTLGGGSTQVDVSSVLLPEDASHRTSTEHQ